jgi:glucose-6-phosphate isomerase
MNDWTSYSPPTVNAKDTLEQRRVSAKEWDAALARAVSVRDAFVDEMRQYGPRPLPNMPLEGRVFERPRRALADYRQNRRSSEVSRLLAVAGRLRETVDRVVVVAAGGALAAIQALVQAGLHPYHNELARGARGLRPSIYFAGGDLDNDALHGLLEVLPRGSRPGSADDAWAVIAIDTGEDALEPLAVLQLLWPRLLAACGDSERLASERLLVVSPPDTRLEAWRRTLPCGDTFVLRDGLPGAWSLFTAAALLPAAALGSDIVQFLVGAVVSSEVLLCPPPATSAVLELAALRHLLATEGAARRTLATPVRALQGLEPWHDGWLVASSAVEPRLGAPCSPGTQRLLVTAERGRCDLLQLGTTEVDRVRLDLPEEIGISTLARHQTQAWLSAHSPLDATVELSVRSLQESALGQFVQSLLLATVVERRLDGFNAVACGESW